MKLTASVLAFSLFSGSVLIGGNFYKNVNNNENVSQLVHGNKKDSQVVNFLKTNRDLEKVKENIGVLNFEIGESNKLIKNQQDRQNTLSVDKYKKEDKIETLGRRIGGSIKNFDLLNHPLKIPNSQASKVVNAQKEFKKIEDEIKVLKAKKLLRITKKTEKKSISEKINKLQQQLKEKRKEWTGYVFGRKSIYKATKDTQKYKKKLEEEQEISTTNLEKTEKSLEDTQASIKELKEVLEIQNKNLNTFKNHKDDLSSELKSYATEILES